MQLRHFMHGKLQIHVRTPFPQRLLNLAAQENLLFWGIDWLKEDEISLWIEGGQQRAFQDLIHRLGGEMSHRHALGLPALWGRLRHRFAFLLGFILSLLTVSLLSHFILVIQIEGNEQIDSAVIRSSLEKAGLSLGIYGPSLTLSQVAQAALSDLEGVSWLAVNLYGTRALVTVREATPPPDIYPTQGLYDIVATTEGIIHEMQIYKGEKLVQVGDTVITGQSLVSGNVELKPPLYSEQPSQWLTVPSQGSVIARTWPQLTAVIPMTAQVKESYGVAQNSWSLQLFRWGHHWFQSPQLWQDGYDKQGYSHTIPRLSQLPLSLSHIVATPYSLTETALHLESCQELLRQRLLQELEQRMGDTGDILSTEFEYKIQDDLLYVTLYAQCLEEIGTVVEGIQRQVPEEPLS